MTGGFIAPIFDLPTLVLILISILVASFMLEMLFKQRSFSRGLSFSGLGIYFFGVVVGQSPPLQIGWNYREKFFTALFSLTFTILGLAFSCLIVATLMSTSLPKQINSLEDLAQMPEIKIIAQEKTFTQTFLMSSPLYPSLKDSLVFRAFDLPSELEVQYADVYSGSFVLVDVLWNIERHLTLLKHDYRPEMFHTSPSLRSLFAGWIISKEDFPHKADILQGIAWLTDFGGSSQYVDAVRMKVFEGYVQDYKPQNEAFNFDQCLEAPVDERKLEQVMSPEFIDPEEGNDEKSFPTRLSLEHFKMVFTFLGISLCLSTVVFILEVVTHSEYCRKKK